MTLTHYARGPIICQGVYESARKYICVSVFNWDLTVDCGFAIYCRMARKPSKPIRAKGRIDTRLTIADIELCDYIRTTMKASQREVNQQIVYMLREFMTAQFIPKEIQ